MKLAILEWICGGGMLPVPVEEIPGSLRQAGWGMVAALVRCLSANVSDRLEPLQLTVAVDERLGCPRLAAANSFAIDAQQPLIAEIMPPAWLELAQSHDWTIVIAPEIDLILPQLVDRLRRATGHLLNAHEPFLTNASDKLRTSARLHSAGIGHPATIGLAELTDAWLAEQAVAAEQLEGEPCWVVKSRTGAGCEGLSRHRGMRRQPLMDAVRRLHAAATGGWQIDQFIVQPWLPGTAFSCSAMVDRGGDAQWMPLMTQEFSEDFKYSGGQLVSSEQAVVPTELLNSTLGSLGAGAYGWIGIDLLFQAASQRWVVIEVNPRLTSSIVALSRSPRFELRLPLSS